MSEPDDMDAYRRAAGSAAARRFDSLRIPRCFIPMEPWWLPDPNPMPHIKLWRRKRRGDAGDGAHVHRDEHRVTAPDSCPRCGTSPVERTEMGDPEPVYVAACACYPRPPCCIDCRVPLIDERCTKPGCLLWGEIQPDPITDPLYDPDLHGGAA